MAPSTGSWMSQQHFNFSLPVKHDSKTNLSNWTLPPSVPIKTIHVLVVIYLNFLVFYSQQCLFATFSFSPIFFPRFFSPLFLCCCSVRRIIEEMVMWPIYIFIYFLLLFTLFFVSLSHVNRLTLSLLVALTLLFPGVFNLYVFLKRKKKKNDKLSTVLTCRLLFTLYRN